MKEKTSLLIHFADRIVSTEIWNGSKMLDIVKTDNAAKYLIQNISNILTKNNLTLAQIDEIGYLAGPNSFTSLRIVTATCLGISLVNRIKLYPMSLERVINSMDIHRGKSILVQLNKRLWYLYENGEWKMIENIPQIDNVLLYDENFTEINLGMMNIIEGKGGILF